jgi:thiol-disulfide isomerase/thioredoxin
MSWLKLSFFILSISLILLVACQIESNQSDSSQDPETGLPASVEVSLLDEVQLSELIGQRDNHVLLINVWATWCLPCREEFPDLVKLAEKYKNRNVDMVAISADYPDEIETKIIPFLQSQQVNFPVYVQNFDKQEDFINFLNLEWSGALPASFVYNAQGEQKMFLLGKQSYDKFVAALETEL